MNPPANFTGQEQLIQLVFGCPYCQQGIDPDAAKTTFQKPERRSRAISLDEFAFQLIHVAMECGLWKAKPPRPQQIQRININEITSQSPQSANACLTR
ncbi:hypothetical protein [Xanthomonas hortorum]|uniref:Uncharacterized protein n=1 Tax=Xanthomonas hortorum TaxID=56454 RepID=A0AA47ID08_9XANT|nr:hypothetical protein [Xanthomonas hortorum]WAH66119.1 hypothetical protein OEG85_09390 [Xanthomonas hortorum]